MGGLRPGLTGLSDLGRRLAGDQEMLPQRILYGVALAFSALLGVGALAGLFPRSHPEVAFVLAVLLGALAMGILASCVARGCRSLWPVAALCGALAVPQAAGWSLSGYLNLLYLVSIIHFGLQMPQGRAMAAVALLLATWCGATTANALVFVRTPDTRWSTWWATCWGWRP